MMYNKEIPYLRVGVEYYKVVHKPLISEDILELIIPWNRQTIMDDFGKDYLLEIPKYDGFCSIPNHVNFKPVLGNFLNRYSALIHSPKEGQFDSTLMFLKHIFQEQLEIGLDYLALLYRKPTQPLPVLCLVSHERNTGKTTFLNFVKEIFGLNVTYNKIDDFRSPFNSGWAGKLVISVDEVLFDKREDSERIKNLSTAKSFKAKGKDKDEVEFFGKFILCSNFEETFIQIGVGETRY